MMKSNNKARKKRVANFSKARDKINDHAIWELRPLFPEIDFSPLEKEFPRRIICPLESRMVTSFDFSENSGLFSCWNCQSSGTLLDFYCRKERVGTLEAVIKLARFFRVRLIWELGQSKKTRKDRRRDYVENRVGNVF
jgi:hypothetical protein